MHQYVERTNYQVITEDLFGDRTINFLYSTAREKAPRITSYNVCYTKLLRFSLTGKIDTELFLDQCRREIIEDSIDLERVANLIRIMLISIGIDIKKERSSL